MTMKSSSERWTLPTKTAIERKGAEPRFSRLVFVNCVLDQFSRICNMKELEWQKGIK